MNILKLKKKPLVVYLLYFPIAERTFKDFISCYKKFSSGKRHELLICFKGFNNNCKNISYWKRKIPFKYTFYLDKEIKNDFDIGSFFRVSNSHTKRLILFLNSYAYPKCKNWLKIFCDNYENKSILGGHGSYGSISSQCLSFFYKDLTLLQSIKYGMVHFIYCKLFPNPHIRTSNFFVKSDDFNSLKISHFDFTKKIQNNYFESGRNGMTNQFLKKKFKLYLVNSDNQKFSINNWFQSRTAFLSNQEKLVISDHRTREFDNLNRNNKDKLKKINWGDVF